MQGRFNAWVSAHNREPFVMSSLPGSDSDRTRAEMRLTHVDVGERAESLSRAVDRSREQERRQSDPGTLKSGETRREQRGDL